MGLIKLINECRLNRWFEKTDLAAALDVGMVIFKPDPWNGEVDFTNYIASPILFPLQTSFSYLYLKALRVFDKGNYSFARREIRAVAMDRFKTEGLEYFDF